MKKANVRVKAWNGGLGIPLPVSITKAAGMVPGQRVLLSVFDGGLIFTPVSKPHETLAERLARFDPIRHGGEAMTVSDLKPIERDAC